MFNRKSKVCDTDKNNNDCNLISKIRKLQIEKNFLNQQIRDREKAIDKVVNSMSQSNMVLHIAMKLDGTMLHYRHFPHDDRASFLGVDKLTSSAVHDFMELVIIKEKNNKELGILVSRITDINLEIKKYKGQLGIK